ncbi:hypothetical protein FQZ97_871700 [compost metagenome]
MATFALISEGITDQVVIEAVAKGYYKKKTPGEQIHILFQQPTRDATDRSRQSRADEDFGGWEQVLEYCSTSERVYEALALSDFLIIHIDSDICWNENIGIDKNQDVDALVSEIKRLLVSRIDKQLYSDYGHQIFFAIPVHSTECWLLPLHATKQSERIRINDCEGLLRDVMKRKKRRMPKEHDIYVELAKGFRSYKSIEAACEVNRSLEIFVDSLP